MVPKEWEIGSFASLGIKTIDGDRGKKYPKKSEYLQDGYCLFLGADNVFNDGLKIKNKVFLTKEKHEQLGKGVVEYDDLLLIMRGNGTGRICSYDQQISPYSHARINSGLIILRLNQSMLDKNFTIQLMRSSFVTKQFDSYMFGSAQPQLTVSILKSLKLPTPKLPEQRKIAKILSTWDKAITTTEKLIATSQQQKKALMQQLLTGKKRLVNPETGMVFEGDWEEVKLADYSVIIMGSSPKSESYNKTDEGLPLLQGNADIKLRKSAPRIYTSQITKECSIGDILLSVRAPVGSIAKSMHHACIGRGIASLKAKKGYSQKYLYQWLLGFEPKWEQLSQGSTFESVNSNDIKTLHLSIPSFEEQQKIASVLTAADKEIELLQAKLAHFKQEKKALMQQLLTGKRRVIVEGIEAA